MNQVLLVDDDPIILLLHGHLVDQANLGDKRCDFYHGQAALDYLDSQSDSEMRYLVLLDINMPVLNGWGFLEALQTRSFREQVQVAIVTSSINPEDRLMASNYQQVISYLVKPISLQSLLGLKFLNISENI